jgi:hypothetical protein
MAEGDRIIAEIRDYDGFTAALRQWIAENQLAYETVGALANLQDGYLAKCISTTPVRTFSRMSLGHTLAALGVKLLLVVDAKRLEAMRPEYTVRKKNGAHANGALLRRKPHPLRGNSAYMATLRAKGLLMISRHRRRLIARKAARIRWARNGSPHGAATPVR